MLSGADDTPISKPLRKVAWRCACGKEAWVERGQVLQAVCISCLTPFWRLGIPPDGASAVIPTKTEGLYSGTSLPVMQSDVTFQHSKTQEAPTLAPHNNTA